MTTYAATTKAADAPEVEEAMYDMRFDGTEARKMATGQYVKDKINGDDKLEWAFTLLDDDGKMIFDEKTGKPITITKLTGVGFNIASKTVPVEVKILKALLTPAEFAAFENGDGVDEESLLGRIVQGEVFVKESGWPGLGQIIKARTKRRTSKADED